MFLHRRLLQMLMQSCFGGNYLYQQRRINLTFLQFFLPFRWWTLFYEFHIFCHTCTPTKWSAKDAFANNTLFYGGMSSRYPQPEFYKRPTFKRTLNCSLGYLSSCLRRQGYEYQGTEKKRDKRRIKCRLLNIWGQLRGTNLPLIYAKLIHAVPESQDYRHYCRKKRM